MKTNSKITVKVNGMEHRTLVGSGAEVSLNDESLVRLHGLEVRPTKKAARGVTGDALNILGKTQLDVELDKKLVRTLVMLVVRDCHYDMLLGVDSLCRMGRVTLDYQNNVMLLGKIVLPLGEPSLNRLFKVHATRDFELKPRHEHWLPCFIPESPFDLVFVPTFDKMEHV